MAMEELIKSFLQDCQDRGMSKETVETYGWDVQDYLKFLSEKDPCKIERSDLKGYLDHLIARGVGKKTAVIYFAVLHTFYDYLLYEGLVQVNPIDPVRKRYLSCYKLDSHGHTHQIISVEDAARLVAALIDIRDKALVVLLFKTGVRRRELIAMDLSDINWKLQAITLKPTAKRTNRVVFFDDEAATLLRRWIQAREMRAKSDETALFIGPKGRLGRGGVHKMIVKAAIRAGLHDPGAKDMESHFSTHCTRHFFTTHLRRAGMPREFIQELRGDVRKDAIDIYDHIDKKELRESYLAHIPQLGV